jgi:hypothetical protein
MGLALVLALGVADVCQTFLGIRSINRAVFRAVADMTTWVADHTQDLSPIMMNSWLCWDLQAQLNFIGRGAPCYFVTHQENRQMNSPGNASTHAELEKIVKEAARNKLHTYFIDDEFPGIHPLRSHKFVQQHSVDTVALGEIARIDVRFFRPDPLRFLIYDLRLNRTWIGVPDYILDFGFQVMPFYEVKATFSAYRVVGTNVRVVAPEDEL